MSETVQFEIGTEVACRDCVCGTLARVVLDPVARAITHVIVEPKHRPGQGRLVPVDIVDAGAKELRLACSAIEFDELEYAEETHFLSAGGEDLGYADGEVLAWPYYGAGSAAGGVPEGPRAYFSSRVPAADVEVRRGESVHAVDGDIGRVHGLVIDPSDYQVTHVLLAEGHLWGKKEIAIPIASVGRVDTEGVHVDLKKEEVRDLPPVPLPERD